MQEDFEGSGEPQETTPPPAAPAPAPGLDPAKLKEERDSLREENRRLNAHALGREHGLSPEIIERLSSVPKDQQEAWAKDIAASIKAHPSSAPQEGAASEPPAEPPEADKLKALDTPPGAPPEPPKPAEDDLDARIRNAKSMDEIAAIHQEAAARARAAQQQ